MKFLSLLLLLVGQVTFAAECKLTSTVNGAESTQTFANVQWEAKNTLPSGDQFKLSQERVGINDYDENVYVTTAAGRAVYCERTFLYANDANHTYNGVKSDCGSFSVSCLFNW